MSDSSLALQYVTDNTRLSPIVLSQQESQVGVLRLAISSHSPRSFRINCLMRRRSGQLLPAGSIRRDSIQHCSLVSLSRSFRKRREAARMEHFEMSDD
jgi:hypothetical protein